MLFGREPVPLTTCDVRNFNLLWQLISYMAVKAFRINTYEKQGGGGYYC
jgi:hypothetical protein